MDFIQPFKIPVLFIVGIFLFSVILRVYCRVRCRKEKEIEVLKFYDDLASWERKYNSPTSKLKRAHEAIGALRSGYWANQCGEKFYLSLEDGIPEQFRRINDALKAGLSYEEMGTTQREVNDFRDGEAQKRSATFLVGEIRKGTSFRGDLILEFAENAGFELEEIGTSMDDLLEHLGPDYFRLCE